MGDGKPKKLSTCVTQNLPLRLFLNRYLATHLDHAILLRATVATPATDLVLLYPGPTLPAQKSPPLIAKTIPSIV